MDQFAFLLASGHVRLHGACGDLGNRIDSLLLLAGFDPSKPDDVSEAELVYHAKDEAQLDRLRKAVQGVFLFRSLDSSQLLKILNALFEVSETEL